jgi:hypothetical protein
VADPVALLRAGVTTGGKKREKKQEEKKGARLNFC